MSNIKQSSFKLKAYDVIYLANKPSQVRYWFYGLIFLLACIVFLPWTQNIKSSGSVTTLMQEQRPQNINSPIPGKIATWWVKEGQFVKKGDTIIQLTEIKEDYLDPNLVARTQAQLNAKKDLIKNYQNKIQTNSGQINALQNGKKLKIQQLQNKLLQLSFKLKGEQAEMKSIINEFNLTQDQYERQQKMFEEGLVSQTQLQQRNVIFQQALAKKISNENKIAQTQQEILNIEIEQNQVTQDFNEKVSKAEGEQFQGMGQISTSVGEIAKLENQVANYTIRNGLYFITAPQDGQIIQANKSGLGEILKEGERITMIVPDRLNYAVEMFIEPMDLPLVNVGQNVRFQFDGFPAIVFSGWPNNSFGTFAGKVIAYENSIGTNGMFRVLVAEDSSKKKWPSQLKIGSGVKGIALLNDVPIWYELWRNINGFPPDYYVHSKKNEAYQK
jgi:multidrug efflux pump subunit AcrA (membrane-fusion protein)